MTLESEVRLESARQNVHGHVNLVRRHWRLMGFALLVGFVLVS